MSKVPSPTPNRLARAALPALCWGLALCLALSDSSVAEPASDGATNTAAPTLTLSQAITLAFGLNPTLGRDGERWRSAEAGAEAAGLWDNPSLEAWVEDWAPDSGGVGDAKSFLGIRQTVPFPGKKSLEREAARAGARQVEFTLRETRAALERDVTLRFHAALAAQEKQQTSRELLRVAEDFAAAARRRTEAGDAPVQEQLRAEIERERARAVLRAVEEQGRLARMELAELLAWPAAAEASLAGSLTSDAGTNAPAEPPAAWLAAHPRWQAALAAEQQAAFAARRARRGAAPDVEVGVAAGRDGMTGEGLVQFGVSLPLPLWNASRSQTRSAEADEAAARADLQRVEAALRREWRGAVLRLQTASAQAAAYREQILPRAEEALRLVRIGFEEGKFGFLDLLDTQRTATETRQSYLDQLLELNAAEAELEYLRRAAGSPNPEKE